jgi:hypothetical protein
LIDPTSQAVTVILRDFQASASFSTILPAGAPLQVRVQIRDQAGATASVILFANVSNPYTTTQSLQTAVVMVQNNLALAQQTGNVNAASQNIGCAH